MAYPWTSRAAAGAVLALAVALAACAPAPAAQQAPPPLAKSDLARPGLLIETGELAGLLDDQSLRIVDLRSADKYAAAHIPGAVNLNPSDLDAAKPDGVQDLAPPDRVAEVLGNLGIGDGSKVVLYDDQKTLWAARVYWALDYLGHGGAAVLNGGFPKWQAERRAVTRTVPVLEKAVFTPKPDPAKIADAAYVKNSMGETSVVFCDARTEAEYTGTGHIPGARNLNWEDNLQAGQTPILKDAARLKELYVQAGITPDKEVITYCATGIRGAQAYFVLRLLGYQKVRNYDGSWQDWGKDAAAPVETGKPRERNREQPGKEQ